MAEHECCHDDNDENHIVRKTAAQLERQAARTRVVGYALLIVGVVCMAAAAGFSGYTAAKAREQSEFNERLSKAIADYQFEHAKQAQESFGHLQNALTCSNLEFAKVTEGLHALDRAAITACFQPPPAAPPPAPVIERKGP